MKKLMIALNLILCCSFSSYAQSEDSTEYIPENINPNEVSVRLNNMNDLLNWNSKETSSFSISYKRRFYGYSLRLGYYSGTDDNDESYLQSVFLKDTTLDITTYKLTSNYWGSKIGIERDHYLSDQLLFFWGVDLNFARVKESPSSNSYWHTINDTVQKNVAYLNNPERKTYYGYNMGLNPFFGLTQQIAGNLSSSLEFSFFAYYSHIQNNSAIEFDEKIRLALNFSF